MIDESQKKLDDFMKKLKREENEAVKAGRRLKKAVQRGAAMDIALAEALEGSNCPSLYLEWAIERYWAKEFQKLIPKLEQVYAKLVTDKNTQDKAHNFNDYDDKVFYLPSKDKKVFCHTSQNRNHIYIWDKNQIEQFATYHVRRYYDRYTMDRRWKFDKEELKKFKREVARKGYEPAIVKADVFHDSYADDYPGVTYPHRYSLEHYINNNFKLKYGDGRDNNYVLSYESFAGPKMKSAVWSFGEIKMVVECYLPCIFTELLERNDDDV